MTLLALTIGLLGVVAYTAAYVWKSKAIPNLGVMFILFVAGQAIDEAWQIMFIFKQHLIDGIVFNFGIFANHQLVVAFGATALLWAAIKTYCVVFSSI